MINRTRRVAGGGLVGAVLAAGVLTPAAVAAPVDAGAPQDDSMVLIWNREMINALERAATPAPVATRVAAIVQTAVFDAVNGLTQRFRPYHVTTVGPAQSSPRAAVVGAAHETLSTLFPTQTSFFDELRTSSLATLSGSDGQVSRGVAWGTSVADQILAWRATDGVNDVLPPYVGSPNPGRWQPTPPLFTAPAFRNYARMTPWAIPRSSAFRPPAPPKLGSAQYAADYAEVESLGASDSTTRTSDETQIAQVWQTDAAAAIWDRVANTLLARSRPSLSLTDTASVLAQLNIAMADALIAGFNAKNFFDAWRPVTAIQAGDTDGNPATTVDATWQPLLVTPPFQEYPAAHPLVSQAAATVLAAHFGDQRSFTVTSAQMPGYTHAETSFSSAAAEVVSARVWGGIHFRFAGNAAVVMGRSVGFLVLSTTMLRADKSS